MTHIQLALISYSVSKIITSEVGPFGIFRKIRQLAGVIFEYELTTINDIEVVVNIIETTDMENYNAILFSCFYCMNFWISMIVCLIHYRNVDALKNVFIVYGISDFLYGIDNGLSIK